jgi:fido (protein-threonine AMPylation protein)
MANNKKKLAVYKQLKATAHPVSLQELLQALGKEYTERTVRRWLGEGTNQGIVEQLGKKRGTRYQAKPMIPSDQCFSPSSVKIIEQVRRPLQERHPTAYDDEWFDKYKPNQSFYFPFALRAHLHQAGKRSYHEEPAGTYAHKIFDRLLIDLSYNSSRLEGNTYTLLDTQKLLLEGTDANGKLDEEKVMILNHKEAIHYLVNKADRLVISKETICTLHYLLSDGLIEARYAGKVRDHGVRIGGSTYIPFENPERLLSQLERIIEKANKIEDPYERSFFLLVHITYLQAFADVNKRTARLSANIPLVTQNLVPLSFNDVGKDEYISAMIAIYELQDVRPLVDLYTFSYLRTCSMYDSTIKALGFDEVRVRYRQQRRAMLREIILNRLVGLPLKEYVSLQTKKIIPKKDQIHFSEDVLEDLEGMDASRIIGLGVTIEELKKYLEIK